LGAKLGFRARPWINWPNGRTGWRGRVLRGSAVIAPRQTELRKPGGAQMTIQGLHHITLVCADAQRTIDFYTQVLGLRLVQQNLTFDDPGSYHLYFGDATGRPGSAVTFFEWQGAARGAPGIGGTHHFALAVANRDGLLKWKRWLTDHGIAIEGPLDRHYFESIYFNDPDGTILEIATLGPGWTIDEAPS